MSSIEEKIERLVDTALRSGSSEEKIPIAETYVEKPSREILDIAEKYCKNMVRYYCNNNTIVCISPDRTHGYIIGRGAVCCVPASYIEEYGSSRCSTGIELKAERKKNSIEIRAENYADCRACCCISLIKLDPEYGLYIETENMDKLRTALELEPSSIEIDGEKRRIIAEGEYVNLSTELELRGNWKGRGRYSTEEIRRAFEKIKPARVYMFFLPWEHEHPILILEGENNVKAIITHS
ncbi:MAG: hypothetical protein GXO26_08020 [Crenarchaeota archaeon]|nr:hypothetical protein [Thermoproteota archaeon]